MSIHHATLERARKLGVILTEADERADHGFEAHWPKMNQRMKGDSAKVLLDEMAALVEMKTTYRSFQLVNGSTDDRTGRPCYHVKCGKIEAKAPTLKRAFEAARDAWKESRADMTDEEAEAEDAEPDDRETGSVVSGKYRARYAEAGHANHCGDWLAVTLNNLVANKNGSDIAFFESICLANGVDTSKYNHSTPGWQGRIRMTGRNILAKKVHATGKLLMPPGYPTEEYVVPTDWTAEQRFVKEEKTE